MGGRLRIEPLRWRLDGATALHLPLWRSSGLTMDAAGNLFGVAANSADSPYLFEPSQNGKVGSNPTVIYTFSDFKKGSTPEATPVLDAAGNLYGTTNVGRGRLRAETVYEASPVTTGKKGQSTYKALHTFSRRRPGLCLMRPRTFTAPRNTVASTAKLRSTLFLFWILLWH
jgi:hypothetical protein